MPDFPEPTLGERLRLYLSLAAGAVFLALLVASVAAAVGGLIGALLDDAPPDRGCEVVTDEHGYRYCDG